MTGIDYAAFTDSGFRFYLERKLKGNFDTKKGRFYADFDGNGRIEGDEYVNVPVENGRLDYDKLLGRIGSRYLPKKNYVNGPSISAEKERGMTEAEYKRKRAAAIPAARFVRGAGKEAKKEVVTMIVGGSTLFDTCSRGVREKTSIKSGPVYAALTTGCFAGGIISGLGEYIFGGQLFKDVRNAGSDIVSGDPEKMGRGVTKAGILGLQLLPLAKIPKVKFRPTGGVPVVQPVAVRPGAGGGSLAYATSYGGAISVSGAADAVVGTAAALSLGSGGKEHSSGEMEKVGRAKKGRIKRTTGLEHSEELLATVLDEYGGDVKMAAADPRLNIYPDFLAERIRLADEGSGLYRHRDVLEHKEWKRFLTDEEVYDKLVEWEETGDILGILGDPDVGMTLPEIRKRISRSNKGYALEEFKGFRDLQKNFSNDNLAYVLERNGLSVKRAAKTFGVTDVAIYQRIQRAPEFSELGRARFLMKNRKK